MLVWALLLGLSALCGALSAILIKKSWAIYVAGAVPWFGLLLALLYSVYLTPYTGGGASMWPIAQLFGGSIAAFSGVVGFKMTRSRLETSSGQQ